VRSNFVHLHLHTSYSLLDGTCCPEDVVQASIDNGMDSVAITDHGVLHGTIDFYQAARKRGIKPIIGCEVCLARRDYPENELSRGAPSPCHLVLLAESDLGYHNLIRLISASYHGGFCEKPAVNRSILSAYHKGLIALSGCGRGEVAEFLMSGDLKNARRTCHEYADIMGKENFYLEMQDHGTDGERKINAGILELSRETGIKSVATNNIHYITREQASSHDILLCIQAQTTQKDPKRMRLSTKESYFKSSREMEELFRDTPQAIASTREIADRCDVEIRSHGMHFPAFPVPAGATPGGYLERLCADGLSRRYGMDTSSKPRDEHGKAVLVRLRHELDIIERTGFTNYYLVVWDFVRFARDRGIPVGIRGSGGASLAAFLIGISDIDPIRYSLILERFLNPERASPPDFDIDFCQTRRSEVIAYLHGKYPGRVANIVTFGTFGARLAIRDIGKVLGIPHERSDRLSRMVPDDPRTTLKSTLARNPGLLREFATDPACQELIKHVFVLEGLCRNTGTHPAGIVIADKPLADIVPMAIDRDNQPITQYSMEHLEKLGLLKMDILGLRTLTVIQDTLTSIKTNSRKVVDLDSIPLDDKATLDLLNRGDAIGVFQLESSGMRELLRRIGIGGIEDLIAVIALYRPGPMSMLDEYINRKTGKAAVQVDHPLLKQVLGETFGVMVYQEQVMQAAIVLAGFTAGQADMLRHAMCKKDTEEMEKQRTLFVQGCARKHRISADLADTIYDKLARFSEYAFNKAHSVAYAIVAYRTAFLKANYPTEFMAALLSSETGDSAKLQVYISEAIEMDLSFLPPTINESGKGFLSGNNFIRFGLGGIRNVGHAAVDTILAERQANGPFAGLADFCIRTTSQTVHRRAVESLVRCGCFDSTAMHRARLFGGIDAVLSHAAAEQRDRQAGQTGLFDATRAATLRDEDVIPQREMWHQNQILAAEKELLGTYVTGHPLSAFIQMLQRYQLAGVRALDQLPDGARVRVGGIVSGLKPETTIQGSHALSFHLDGTDGEIDVEANSALFSESTGLLRENALVFVSGKIERGSSEPSVAIFATEIHALDEAPLRLTEHISIHMATTHLEKGELTRVKETLRRHHGPVPVTLCLESPGGKKTFVDTGEAFGITPDHALLLELERLVGESGVYIAVRPI